MVAGAKSRRTVPAAPAGSTHACCQPSTVRAVSRRPSRVAVQPALTFCGTTSNVGALRSATCTRRCSGVPLTERAGVRSATAGAAPSRVSTVEVTRKASVPPATSRCAPANRSTIRALLHGRACTGRSALRSPTVLLSDRFRGSPSTDRTGPSPQGTSIAVAGSIGSTPGTSTSLTPTPSRVSAPV